MQRRILVLLISCTLLTAATAWAAASQSPGQWHDTATQKITRIWQELKAAEGFGYARDAVFGSLEEGDDEYFEFEFVGHRDYVVVGICDNDCSDLDLLLYDYDDNVIMQDVDPDDEPVLVIPAGRSGTYYIEAAMPSCSVEPCYYAVQVFHRFAGDDE